MSSFLLGGHLGADARGTVGAEAAGIGNSGGVGVRYVHWAWNRRPGVNGSEVDL